MQKKWLFEDGVYGTRMVMLGPWSERALDAVQSHGVVELYLNYAKGWEGDLSFLESLAGIAKIQWLKVLDWSLEDLEPIHFLKELRHLSIHSFSEREIRFQEFPHLELVHYDQWHKNAGSLFLNKNLKDVWLNHYSGKNLRDFSRLPSLTSLALLNTRLESLNGVESLSKLESLEIANARRLVSLEGLEKVAGLRELKIYGCKKLKDIEPLRFLPHLKTVHLFNVGDLPSLRPIEGMDELETFFFIEDTNILDGDISPLLSCKNLKEVGFMNRLHYSHFEEDEKLVENKRRGQKKRGRKKAGKGKELNDEWFWKIVEKAKEKADGSREKRPKALKSLLKKLDPDQIVEFYKIYMKKIRQAYSWDLWGAAYLIQGGCGDDGFEYWRDFLISEGKEIYMGALKAPDTLASLDGLDDVDLEGYRYAIHDAFEELTGEEMPMDVLEDEIHESSEPDGEEWDEEDLAERFPKLAKKYGSFGAS